LSATAGKSPVRAHNPKVVRSPLGGNLGWGHGPHTCIGIHFAKIEMQALLRALVAHVATIETVEDPPRIRNNTLQGIAALPVHLA
jgi:cytochrome P450